MRDQNRIDDLGSRLKAVITGTCNTIGCGNCSLKWTTADGKEECSATDLQSKLMDAELGEAV